MYIKDFDYSGHLARTLSVDYLGVNDNGWEVTGEIHSNYFEWINRFEAHKDDMWIKGDFEEEVKASSKEAYDEFVELFPFQEWDYWNI